ncbi:MAG: hypothetical protein R6U28_12715 [Cyclonatronaceae bacterium]
MTASSAVAQDHERNLVRYSAWQDGANTVVIIEWEVANTDLIADYRLEKSMSGNPTDFQAMNRNNCSQTGNLYRCKDTDLWKGGGDQSTANENSVSYRLRVTDPDGDIHDYFTVTAQYTTNAVRRTWGDIKSMFQ